MGINNDDVTGVLAELIEVIVTLVSSSHIFGERGANKSGDDVLVSAIDSPSLLHLESIFLRFNFRSWKRLILSSSLYGPRLSVIIPVEKKFRFSFVLTGRHLG